MRRIGIVTAMRVEARCITRLRLPFNRKMSLNENAAIWLCGMGSSRARIAAEGLRAQGATALMSFGFAGGLDPTLRPGDLLLPESIAAHQAWRVDSDWRNCMQQRLSGCLSARGGILASSETVLTSAEEKNELAAATGAVGVDMESASVAEVAASAGLPFLAVRAISDPVEFSPPGILLQAIRPDGSAALTRLLPLLLGGSVSVSALLRLAADSRAACSTLSAVVRHASVELGIDRHPAAVRGEYASGNLPGSHG